MRNRRFRTSPARRSKRRISFWNLGLVLAIEPMVALGTKNVETLGDHWTIVTKDRRASAHFEHTVAMTPDGPQILTSGL